MGHFLFRLVYNSVLHLHPEEVRLKASVPSLETQAWFDRLRVVLVRPRNPLNIGAAARAMSNFGFSQLRLVSPWEPSYLDARSAVGAAELLRKAEVFSSVADAVADCGLVVGTTAVGERELQHPLRVLAEGAEQMRAKLSTTPVALLFGSEKSGLSNDELSHCHWLMRIPTRGEHISMNLGQAVAICMYEIARLQAQGSAATETRPASAAEVERLTGLLFEALEASDYIPALGSELMSEKLRRLVYRLNLEHEDAEIWLGMMRKILWKLRHSVGS